MKYSKLQAARMALYAAVNAFQSLYKTLQSEAMWDQCEKINATTELDMKYWYNKLKGKHE